MAKLTAPLLSMGARGQIGKAMVTANWKGVKYARQYVIPANPRTTAQQANRTRFALLREMWKLAPPLVQAPWTAFAKGRPFTNFNKFVGENNRLLNGQTTMDNLLASPGAGGGLPPATVSAATGANPGEVVVTIEPPAQLPTDWIITACAAAAINDQDPVGLFDGLFIAGSDAVTPYAITLAGFADGAECMCFGWVVYEKPDGSPAYSVSISEPATAGA